MIYKRRRPTEHKPKTKAVAKTRMVYLNARHYMRFLIRLSIALVMLAWAGFNLYFGIDSTAWPIARGSLFDASGGTPVYSYTVNGQMFGCNRIRFGDFWIWTSEHDLEQAGGPRQNVQVRYNPDWPSMSVLLPGFNQLNVFIPLGVGMFFFITAGKELTARLAIR